VKHCKLRQIFLEITRFCKLLCVYLCLKSRKKEATAATRFLAGEVRYLTGAIGFLAEGAGDLTGEVRFPTGAIGFLAGAVGYLTGEVRFPTGVIGFLTEAVGYLTGEVNFPTGAIGFLAEAVGYLREPVRAYITKMFFNLLTIIIVAYKINP
jgi:hypothetical protein